MEQDKRDSPPLWLQLPTSAAILRQRRRPPPIPASLLIFIPLVSLLFIFFLFSYFVSNTSQIFRINLVKNGWDLLNVVLVVFAILCGLAGKLSDDQTSAVNTEVAIQDGTVSNKETARFSVFDEFNVSVSDAPASESVYRRERRREVEDESDIKVIPVDTCVIRRHLSPPAVASKPKLKRRRTPKSVLQPEKELTGDEYGMRQSPPSTTDRRPHNNNNRKKRDATSECVTAITSTNDTNPTTQPLPPSSPSPPPPPLPPPRPSVFRNMFRKSTKPKRIHSEASALPPPPPLPPTKAAAPQPPNSIFRFKNKQLRSSTSRPPQSIFNNILKSRIKSKRFDSSTATPPPPPPPPPTSIFSNKFKSQLKNKLSRTSIAPPHPPLPLPNSIVENISTTTPPPPPPYPPPSIFNNLLKFGTKSKRIVSSSAPRPPPQTQSIHLRSSKPPLPKKVKNQYVDATDTQSSEIGVSNLDLWSKVGPQEVNEGNNPVGSVLCPSPDVNMKAEKFIARLRSEWNLDKTNSFKESPSL